MRTILFAAVLALGACGSETGTYINALNGQACDPNGSYQPKPPKKPATNDKCQGTSVGDNCDDLSSGKIDCIGDGNSGQGDDKKHNCQFPQPGCDENGCCDEDLVDPVPPTPEEPPPPPPDDGTGDPPPDAGTEPPPLPQDPPEPIL
jgi:hypothetical protein